jgi:hypothetical protein
MFSLERSNVSHNFLQGGEDSETPSAWIAQECQ